MENRGSKLTKIVMVFKRIILIFILFTGVFVSTPSLWAQKVQRVVIDAGHGGHDPGAVGKYSKEKDITLSIALKTGNLIKEHLKDVEVIYTRKTDVFVELHRRARIANEAKADLFISIHCNANKSTTPYGSETYVMGLHRSDANLAVAQLENASILLEDDYHVQYEGFDPRSPEGYIFFSMLQNAFLDQGLDLASRVQGHFRDHVKLYDRGVKQAGFLVLYKTTMPSVLIEAGFISNANEEKLLASESGQNKIAQAIFRAVKDYKHAVGKIPPARYDETASAEGSAEPANSSGGSSDGGASSSTTGQATDQTTATGLPVFKVQFMITKTEKRLTSPEFNGIKEVGCYYHQGMYKYTAGNERTPEDAMKIKKELDKKGYRDSFVIAFINGERISIDEARKQLKN
ncbi:N-acetylmuramoyl-L-alanine amidase [Lentimicrobium saccharophilum]|uniref:N-acetylmuramoyl-L-alanine amidase n=1 Tax=Lentimicrobium saccharophilum TaxID=1678841 RepID=A0A0S7BXI4_9BACT|nr:N-acetylmuramoyl-L-alanine amidase [Lentimicrobium saccharophilum]GAP45261.1 N-acetylmuramoyl-L-alanine amidase [Lentimicrobium saccharophilum]